MILLHLRKSFLPVAGKAFYLKIGLSSKQCRQRFPQNGVVICDHDASLRFGHIPGPQFFRCSPELTQPSGFKRKLRPGNPWKSAPVCWSFECLVEDFRMCRDLTLWYSPAYWIHALPRLAGSC